MPNPLTSVYNWATSPMVPKQAIAPAQQALEEPHLNQSPLMAGLKGFGSGALEGLRGMTTPMNVASLALPYLKGVGGAGEAVSGLRGAMQAGSELAAPMAEFAPATEAGEAAFNATRPTAQRLMTDPVEGAFQRISQSRGINPATPTAGSADTLAMMDKVQAAKDARRAAEGLVTTGR